MRCLLTGASGFLGSHALRHLLVNTDWHLVCPVSFEHKGLPERIVQQAQDMMERVTVIRCDLAAPIPPMTADAFGPVDYIVNYASQSHVDRSIAEPRAFIRNNVDIMLSMLDYARLAKPQAFVQISTDEVYGPAPAGRAHAEWDPVLPSNPYSASKAAQEHLGFAYWRTFGVPLIITNCMNLIGEMQDPEKYVPMTMKKVLNGDTVTVHASAEGTIGSRFYLHARNLADAVLFLLRGTEPLMYGGSGADRPAKWHIVGEREVSNLELAELIAGMLGRPLRYRLEDFHSSRPGHDLRYALDGTRLESAGWSRPVPFEPSLKRMIEWTLERPQWLAA